MKWYKHISDSLDDPFIFDLMTEFGCEGYVVFFGTIEIYSREFLPEKGWKLSVSLSFLHQKLRVSSLKVKKILSKIYKWDVSYEADKVTIFIPKFTELMDEWTQRKLGSRSGVAPEILTHDTDKDIDKDIEEENKEKEQGEEIPPFPSAEKIKEPPKKTIPPLIAEVRDYCMERKNKIDPEAWMAFYSSNGWLVGKNKMRDWRAAIITWEKRGGNGNGNGGNGNYRGKSTAPGAAGRAQSDGRPYPIDAEF